MDPLVLVGDPLTRGEEWRQVRPLLAPAFQMLSVPTPEEGAERSDPPGTFLEASLARALERPDFYPAHVLASSFAVAPVLRLAAHRPDLFRSLLLHEPIVRLESNGAGGDSDELHRAFIPLAGAIAAHDPAQTLRAWQSAFGEEPAIAAEHPAPDPTLASGGDEWLRQWQSPEAWSIPATMAEFLPPSLVIEGELAPGFVRRIGEEVARRFPNVVRLALPGAGHFLPTRDPARLAGVVMTFCLERNVPTA